MGTTQAVRRLGLLIFVSLALGWPAAVLANDPGALRVWSLEMSEKTGLSHILEHRWHSPLVGQWPGLVLPWTFIAAVAVLLPLLSATIAGSTETEPRRRAFHSLATASPSTVWFAWWWAVGNLVVFCTWAVAKPNYYIPCLPGMALLIGAAWLHLARAARGEGRARLAARGILQAQWVLMFVAAAVAPLVVRASAAGVALALVLAIARGRGRLGRRQRSRLATRGRCRCPWRRSRPPASSAS